MRSLLVFFLVVPLPSFPVRSEVLVINPYPCVCWAASYSPALAPYRLKIMDVPYSSLYVRMVTFSKMVIIYSFIYVCVCTRLCVTEGL